MVPMLTHVVVCRRHAGNPLFRVVQDPDSPPLDGTDRHIGAILQTDDHTPCGHGRADRHRAIPEVLPAEWAGFDDFHLGHAEAFQGLTLLARGLALLFVFVTADRAGRQPSRVKRRTLRTLDGLGFCLLAFFNSGASLNVPVGQDAVAEVEDEAVVFDDALVSLGVDLTQTTPNHLNHGALVATRAEEHDARHRLAIPALREHGYVDEDLELTFVKRL
jgi:hypothetical protein